MRFKLLLKVVVPSFIMLMAGCAVSPSITTDFDTSYDFTSLKTYRWVENDGQKAISLNRKREMNAIESVLNRKGFRKVTKTLKADFLIKTHTVVDKKINIDQFYSVWEHNPYFQPYFPSHGSVYPHLSNWPQASTTVVREIKVGTLVLDIVDSVEKAVIWRGTVANSLNRDKRFSPEERNTKALKNAEAMLVNFPPLKPVPKTSN